MSTFGEGSHVGGETGGDQQQHAMGQISRLLEDRGASQDVKMNGMIGVSSLVRSRKCADERCTSTYYGDHVGPTR